MQRAILESQSKIALSTSSFIFKHCMLYYIVCCMSYHNIHLHYHKVRYDIFTVHRISSWSLTVSCFCAIPLVRYQLPIGSGLDKHLTHFARLIWFISVWRLQTSSRLHILKQPFKPTIHNLPMLWHKHIHVNPSNHSKSFSIRILGMLRFLDRCDTRTPTSRDICYTHTSLVSGVYLLPVQP